MTQISRFWDGVAVGDATLAPYDAATEFARVMQSVSGAGGVATNQSAVFRGELNELAVTGAATPVSVNTGRAIVAGSWYENDAAATVAIPTPAALTRIDRIVLRKDWSAAVQTVRITRIAGAEGGAAPGLTQVWGTTWDEPLAQVSIDITGVITLTDQRQFVGGGPLVNVASFAIGDLLYANSTTTLARLADVATGSVLVSGGVGVAPAWSANPTVATLTTTGTLTVNGTGVSTIAGQIYMTAAVSDIRPGTTSWGVLNNATSAYNLFISDSGRVGIRATTNAFMTQGLTIQQGGADNEILSLKSTDVAHGMTDLTETDTYGLHKKFSATAGGHDIWGLSSGNVAVRVVAVATTGDTTKSSVGIGAFYTDSYLKNVNSLQAMGATDNIAVFRNGGASRFIFQADGTSYEDVGTAWVNYDDHNDVELLTDLAIAASRADDAIHKRFASFLRYSPEMLQAMDLIHFNTDGHHFANRSKIQMALIGASRQLGDRVTALERENQELRNMLAIT